MNRVKYRPVGKAGPIVQVKVAQTKRAVHSLRHPRPTVANANRNMDAAGYVRAGVRHG